jgi:hypothetical protein
MNYRTRAALGIASVEKMQDQETARYLLAQAYRSVFAGPQGEKVLNDIVQRICGVDAIVTASEPMHAVAILERANVGKQIAALALAPELKSAKVEVSYERSTTGL